MAHGLYAIVKRADIESDTKSSASTSVTMDTQTATVKMGSRRIFTPQFKIQVLDSYRNDDDCKGNQRATARKYGIHRRQIQKWLQCETNLRSSIVNNYTTNTNKTGLNGEVINAKSNGNRNGHHMPHHPHTTANTETPHSALSLDFGRHSVAVNENISASNSSSSNKYTKSCYPVLPHQCGYAPVPFVHVMPSSTGLPCSPIFSASAKQYKLCDSSTSLNGGVPPSSSLFSYECKTEPLAEQEPTESPFYYSELSPPIATPIDLSISNRIRDDEPSQVPVEPCTYAWHNPVEEIHYTDLSNSNVKAWDLSFRKRSRSNDSKSEEKPSESEHSHSGPTPPKIVKLFKPYLLSEDDEKFKDKEPKNYKQEDPIIWSSYSATCSPCYDDYNNNVPVCYDAYASINLKYPVASLPYESSSLYNSYYGLGSPVSGYESASPCYSTSSSCESSEIIRSGYAIDFRIQPFDSQPMYYGITCGSS